MILISIIFIFFYLINSVRFFGKYNYGLDIDQFMYSGSRLINGEITWIKEFDDKSPVLQIIFAIPALLNNVDYWLFFNIFITLLGTYYLFRIIMYLNSYLTKNIRSVSIPISLFSSSFYLFLISFFKPTQINIFSVNLLIISLFLVIKSYKNYINKNKNWIIFIFFAAFIASIGISVRPYLLIAFILNGIWIPFRESFSFLNFEKNNKILSSHNLKFIFLWLFLISSFLIFLNIFPYILNNNLSIFITTIKFNSVEYGSLSRFDTLMDQINFLGRFKFFVLILSLIYVADKIFILKFRKRILFKFKYEKITLKKYFLDFIFFGIISPLSIQFLIINRHFFPHYLIFMSFNIILLLSLNLSFLANLFKINMIFKNLLILSFVLVLISLNIRLDNKQLSPKYSTDRNQDLKIIKNTIIFEKNKNNNIEFLFPFDNFYHWKLNQSRHGFPMASVFSYISSGKFDKVIDSFPNLNYNYILTKQNKICETLIEKGPELIFLRNGNSYKDKFIYSCLNKSKKYSLDNDKKELINQGWNLFKSF